MKKLPLRDFPSLAEHAADLETEPVVLTRNGRAVAAVVALPNVDAETISLSYNPQFLAIIERSRVRHEREGGVSPNEMRQRLGLPKRTPRPKVRKPRVAR